MHAHAQDWSISKTGYERQSALETQSNVSLSREKIRKQCQPGYANRTNEMQTLLSKVRCTETVGSEETGFSVHA